MMQRAILSLAVGVGGLLAIPAQAADPVAFAGTYSFTSLPYNAPTDDADADPAGVELSAFSMGAGILRNATTGTYDYYNTRNYQTTSSLDTANNDYVTFNISAETGRHLNLDSFTFKTQRSDSGPKQYAVYYAVNDDVTDEVFASLQSGSATASLVKQTIDVSSTTFDAIAQVTFRIYGWGGSGISGTLRFDDVSVGGNSFAISAVPEAGTVAMVGGLVALVGCIRRRG